MKNYLLATLLALFVATTAYPQEFITYNRKFSFGVKTSWTSSAFTKRFENITEYKHGVAGGFFFGYQLTNWFAPSAEVLYVQQGASGVNPLMLYYAFSPAVKNISGSAVALHNLETPLLLNFYVPGVEKIYPKLYIGGAYTYNFKSYATNLKTFTDAGVPVEVWWRDDITSHFKFNDWAAIAGVGITFVSNKLNYTFDLRYRAGLTNINNVSGLGSYGKETISFGLGVGF